MSLFLLVAEARSSNNTRNAGTINAACINIPFHHVIAMETEPNLFLKLCDPRFSRRCFVGR
jgi:hypothetical protein